MYIFFLALLAVLPAANSEGSFLFSSVTTENLGFVIKMQETNQNFISTKLALPAKEVFYQLLISQKYLYASVFTVYLLHFTMVLYKICSISELLVLY